MENPFETEKPVRPTFLTVLCILTFIGSGWGTVSNLFSLVAFSPEAIVAQIQQITTMTGTEGAPSWMSSFMGSSIEMLQTTIKHAIPIYSLLTLFALMSLSGAILMFNLKRTGFYLYTFAQIAQLFVLPMYSGWNMVVMASMIVSGFFALLFIILYGVNLSKMRN
ncbi:hypothetical protein [Butyricimonas hominis]|uniref:DUF4386 domain-containing protein n=1 Tax=Butyricimonas hominis TaxID=2763032 RepID=A0ABR7CXU8_9BACT|nr:hypothetical protein [Butyricimonas hominis]MBC5620501.1 hypothetical protein [Butyricimonas hominis]